MKGAGRGDEKIEKVPTIDDHRGRLTRTKEAGQRMTRTRAINIKMGEQDNLIAKNQPARVLVTRIRSSSLTSARDLVVRKFCHATPYHTTHKNTRTHQ